MSGAKRKTKYRKHVESDILEGLPEPGDGEHIVRVVASRGGNMLEVCNAQGEEALCLLPAKFRKLVWVKRGNFLIASYSSEEYDTASGKAGKVKYTVKHILFKDQIKHLKKEGIWPDAFEEESSKTDGNPDKAESDAVQKANVEKESGLEKQASTAMDNLSLNQQTDVYSSSEDSDSDLFVNRNRRVIMDDSSSEEDSEEEGE